MVLALTRDKRASLQYNQEENPFLSIFRQRKQAACEGGNASSSHLPRFKMNLLSGLPDPLLLSYNPPALCLSAQHPIFSSRCCVLLLSFNPGLTRTGTNSTLGFLLPVWPRKLNMIFEKLKGNHWRN